MRPRPPPLRRRPTAALVARGKVRQIGERIPPDIRLPVGRIMRGQIDTLLALPALAVGVVRRLSR